MILTNESGQEVNARSHPPIAVGGFSRILHVRCLESATKSATESTPRMVLKYPTMDEINFTKRLRRLEHGDSVLVPMGGPSFRDEDQHYEPARMDRGRFAFERPELATACVAVQSVRGKLRRGCDDRQCEREAEVAILRELARLGLAPTVRGVFPVRLHERVRTLHYAVCMDRCDCTYRDLIVDPEVSDSERWAVLEDMLVQLQTLQRTHAFVHGDLKSSNVGIMRHRPRRRPSDGRVVPHRFLFLDTGFSRMNIPGADRRTTARYYQEEPPPGHDVRMLVASFCIFLPPDELHVRPFFDTMVDLFRPVAARITRAVDPASRGTVRAGFARFMRGGVYEKGTCTEDAWMQVYETTVAEPDLAARLQKLAMHMTTTATDAGATTLVTTVASKEAAE